jgi:hypothetical protein
MHTIIIVILLAAVIVGIVFLVRRVTRKRNTKIAAEVRRQIELDTHSAPVGER